MSKQCHEVDYEVIGQGAQMLVVELDPGETVIAEAGAMTYMEEGIEFEARMGDGSEAESGLMGKLFSAGKRMISGESLFMTHFTHRGSGKGHVAFSAPYAGEIIPLDLSTIGGQILCQKDAFLSAALGTKLDIAFTKKLGVGFFGGEGFILEKLTGDGMVFIHAGGTVVERQLNNETLRVDTGCIVALEQTVNFDIRQAGNIKTALFGGEGLFFATLHGPGKIWLQSLPFSRLAGRMLQAAPQKGGSRGEGSLLGSLGGLLDGDNRF